MKKFAFLLAFLLTFAAVHAQDDDTSTMTGGEVTDQDIGDEDAGMAVSEPVEALEEAGDMTGGEMMGDMTGGDMMGDMTGEAMMMQSTEVTLSGDEQVPPVETDATGSATVRLSGNTMSVQGDVSGLSSPLVEVAGSSGHVHMAPMGENGGVVFPLNVTEAEDGMSAIFSLETELSDEQLEALMAGELYLNFHTEMYPDGEVRGQIMLGM